MLLLGWNLGGQTAEFVAGAIEGMPHLFALVAIEVYGGARQSAVGPAGDGHHHLQIAQQFGHGEGNQIGLALPLRFEKQLGLFENPLPDRRRSVPPSGIQLPGFAAGEPVCRQGFRQALAVLGAGTRHRHQILHRQLGRDGATAHLLLNAFRKQFHQR
jgi:hypothetical protein